MIVHAEIANIDIPMTELIELCRRYQVSELALFGAALTDDFQTDSDVDLLVSFQPGAKIGFIKLSRMQRELSALLRRPVDLAS